MIRRIIIGLAFAILAAWQPTLGHAAECYQSTIIEPTPFLGNDNEIFQLADGSIWQVKFEYEYLYEYYPDVVICPDREVLIIGDSSLNVVPLRAANRASGTTIPAPQPSNAITVIYRIRGCDYFAADGPAGLYILEWYGGYDPDVGDVLIGYERGYGFKTVTYLKNGRQGRVWAEDYLLSTDSAARTLSEKCS